jgi:hypothetical protein
VSSDLPHSPASARLRHAGQIQRSFQVHPEPKGGASLDAPLLRPHPRSEADAVHRVYGVPVRARSDERRECGPVAGEPSGAFVGAAVADPSFVEVCGGGVVASVGARNELPTVAARLQRMRDAA